MTDAVRNNQAGQRYELTVDGEVAFAAYRMDGPERIAFVHTVVPPALEGQGIASRLIAFALDDVRRKGFRVLALCSFVAAYIERHPETRELLADDRGGQQGG